MNKRDFIKQSALGITGAFMFPEVFKSDPTFQNHVSEMAECSDDRLWESIRSDYQLPKDWINLENGYYCIQPQSLLKAYYKHIERVNSLGAYYMRTEQFSNKTEIASQLAHMAGCSSEELIITRNTTESLDMIISGFPWQSGDEAIVAEQDYGAMLDMFQQVQRRHGIVVKTIQIPNEPMHSQDIVNRYKQAITSNTKLIMACHMINITGHILPIREICDMAHQHGVEVMVDGAHSFAHLDFKLPDLNCDYFGCSLHKWLSNPLGAGLLYIKKNKISKIWPLFAEATTQDSQIARLNHTGTHPVAVDLTLANAMQYYLNIGAQRKEKRLRELQQYWTSAVRGKSRIALQTPSNPMLSCGIANVGIEGISPKALSEMLFKKYQIYTVAIDGKGVQGCRITPNLYTNFQELDCLIKALLKIASSS